MRSVPSMAVAVLLTLFSQGAVLRVSVVLPDGNSAPIPLPRVLLLVSDNPATGEPRRVRTDANGLIELKLAPGSYTIESDRPVSFGGKAYAWTQYIDVIAGQDTVLELTAKNAEVSTTVDAPAADATAPDELSSAVLLSRWHDSVFEIWTATRHAQGFLIDRRGLVATSHRALNGATSVEVEIRTRTEHFKVPGTVIADDRLTGAAIVWVDPLVTGAITPIALRCGSDRAAAQYQDPIATVAAPMLSGKDAVDGVVTRVTAQAIFADLRIARETAGGPVFNASGEPIGISSIEEDPKVLTRVEAWVVPSERACETLAAAEKAIAGRAPPKAVRLPVETGAGPTPITNTAAKPPRTQIATLKASDFDIALLTTTQAREFGGSDPRGDLDNWNDYIRYAPPLLLVRISPQYEESFWKTLARGAASTQGVNLPPLKSFSANFARMRALCGDTEVVPIHPFIIERRINDKQSIREGLYVFGLDAFGPQCSTIKFSMFSEKSPDRADTKEIDPKLFEQLTKTP